MQAMESSRIVLRCPDNKFLILFLIKSRLPGYPSDFFGKREVIFFRVGIRESVSFLERESGAFLARLGIKIRLGIRIRKPAQILCLLPLKIEIFPVFGSNTNSDVSKGGPRGAMAPQKFFGPFICPPHFLKRFFVNFYHLLRKGFCQASKYNGLTFSQDLIVSLLPATEIFIILYY